MPFDQSQVVGGGKVGGRADRKLLVLFPFSVFLFIFAWDIYLFHLALLRQYYSIIRPWQLYCLINLKKRLARGERGREVNVDGCVVNVSFCCVLVALYDYHTMHGKVCFRWTGW